MIFGIIIQRFKHENISIRQKIPWICIISNCRSACRYPVWSILSYVGSCRSIIICTLFTEQKASCCLRQKTVIRAALSTRNTFLSHDFIPVLPCIFRNKHPVWMCFMKCGKQLLIISRKFLQFTAVSSCHRSCFVLLEPACILLYQLFCLFILLRRLFRFF